MIILKSKNISAGCLKDFSQAVLLGPGEFSRANRKISKYQKLIQGTQNDSKALQEEIDRLKILKLQLTQEVAENRKVLTEFVDQKFGAEVQVFQSLIESPPSSEHSQKFETRIKNLEKEGKTQQQERQQEFDRKNEKYQEILQENTELLLDFQRLNLEHAKISEDLESRLQLATSIAVDIPSRYKTEIAQLEDYKACQDVRKSVLLS